MLKAEFRILQPNDHTSFQVIADWYFSEWKIPHNKTIQKLQSITTDHSQFQVLMTLDRTPVSTGGLYNHVGLLDKEPRFKIHQNWLALVYTAPDKRNQGYGALICKHIQDLSKKRGIETMYLFTDTAEQLYKRLGWVETERLQLGMRNIVVMKKDLINESTQ